MIKRILLLALAAAALLFATTGCSSADTDEHGVVRQSDGWF